MSFRNSNSAESWEKVYEAFTTVNFAAFDYETIKASLIEHLRTYYPERFNDYIESSELIMLIESFAYVAEQLAYRLDMLAHENFITTAQRKQSILKLARLISYKPTRNIPVRGLVKFTSVSTSERVIDSRGVNLAGLVVNWNDPNNSNWKEQFILVMNRVLTSRFGQPQKSFQVDDVVMTMYGISAAQASLMNGVYPFTASTGLDSYPMEIVPADIDVNGPFEREPDLNAALSIIYATDGIGDGSDYTGFLAYVKQGSLTRIDYTLNNKLPNRQIEFIPNNVNHTDVWVQKLDSTGNVAERWKQVETVSEQNLIFNDDRETRKKYEVSTLENDQISILFGDGDFAEIPVGSFRFWMRQSINKAVVIPKSKVENEIFTFNYLSNTGNTETCTLTFSLTTTLQNGSASETIEHLRRAAPETYYAQHRMVNGQDYNTYPLRDPSILRLKTINRTFAGQPKYIDWNDASGNYENIKLFGDDLTLGYELGLTSVTTGTSGQALIDRVIEPLLAESGILTALTHISATHPATVGVVSAPRKFFLEDNRSGFYNSEEDSAVSLITGALADGSLKEKTTLQGVIDRHWYGEPLEYVEGPNSQVWARIPDPGLNPKDDSRIYAASVPRTIDGLTKYPPGDTGSGLQPIADQDYFALRYNRTMAGIGNGSILPYTGETVINTPPNSVNGETWTIEFLPDGFSFNVRSNLRGTFPTGTLGQDYDITVSGESGPSKFFKISAGSLPFSSGDAFILDTISNTIVQRSNGTMSGAIRYFNNTGVINLLGWWEILGAGELGAEYSTGPVSSDPSFHDKVFTMDNGLLKKHSWLIFVRKLRQSSSNIVGYEIHHRDLKLVASSKTTKFWYNGADQILDGETKKRVYDNIKILRSNLDGAGHPLKTSQTYDVVGSVKSGDGQINFNKIQIVPTDSMNENSSGDLEPDRLLQFETFAGTLPSSYQYFRLDNPNIILSTTTIPSDSEAKAAFNNAAVSAFSDSSYIFGRRQLANNGGEGLDFMWQHFAPHTNIIDPSPTNIHDAYMITQGYYQSVISFIRGETSISPITPTPLDLKNSYAQLFNNKMLSDTVILHPGKLRLLFGDLAEPQLRAKFRVVRTLTGTLTNERIKEELLTVINAYFDIKNWDFGETFYATDLISLMHQRLPTEIASVVLVPLYSTNSFGDLFTVNCGFDEILQSAARVTDIEIVESLTSTVLRQSK